MPRSLRVFVEGGIYHVYNRFASGERDELSAEDFIGRSAAVLDIDVAVASRSRQTHVVEARRLIIALGRERWVQSTKDLASALEKSADTVTYIQREGVRQRLDDEEFSLRFENLDEALIGRGR